jgi:hypothetical protein
LAVQILIRIPKSILFSSQNLFIRPLHRISCRFNISWKEKPTPKRHKSFYFPILILHGERHFFVSQWESSETFFCEVLGKISDKKSSPGKASPQGRGPYLFKEEIRPKEGPNFHHQGVIMICDITSDSNTFDYFLEEALVKRSVEPAEIALLKTSPLNSLIGVKPTNHRAKQGK